jgi:phenylalanyl-tRNA synthetase beta chain
MRVVHSWLQDYLPFTLSPEELAGGLSMLGLEIEGIDRPGEKYRGFVVGLVLERNPHPRADRLSVCTVDIGTARLQVVCGAPNVAPGQKVVVGTIGAVVPKNQHDPAGKPFTLSRVAIRGVESSGMICSAYELDLGTDAEGILVLDPGAVVGRPLTSHLRLDDVAYDVEITANRPDWLSHIGVAREIGVLVGRRVRQPRVRVQESAEPAGKHLRIRVEDPVNCPRFAARVLRGVTIGPSPEWMQDRLTAAGLRPRNNVVDVTNYVMLECGQPLHAFDLSLLRGGTIVVRQAGTPMAFRTLDGKEHQLPPAAVMVCDAEREVSIAGIMGGANSEINDGTTDVVLESAYWNPASIRRTRRALGIVTDASQRFERGADPNASDFALARAATLIRECSGGAILKGTIDVYPAPVRQRRVPLRVERVNAVLGTTLSAQQTAAALKRLGLRLSGKPGKRMSFSIPTFRVDLEREIDLIEEVARVHGYDNIGIKTSARIDFDHPFPKSDPTTGVRELLIGFGYQEAITNSLQPEVRARSGPAVPARLANQQNQEMSALRTSLLPGLLDAVALNQSRGNVNLRLFEIGHVFSVDEGTKPRLVGKYLEEKRVGMVLTGLAAPRHWSSPTRPASFFDMKGDVADLLYKIILDKGRFISYSTTDTLAESVLGIEIQGGYAGYLGSVRSDVLKGLGIEQEVLFAELDLSLLSTHGRRRYTQLPRFPRVRRDLAFVLDATLNAQVVEETMRKAASELLTSLEVFDVYEGKNLPSGKKSLAFSLELMSPVKTLTESEIDAEIHRIVEAVERMLGAVLRTV